MKKVTKTLDIIIKYTKVIMDLIESIIVYILSIGSFIGLTLFGILYVIINSLKNVSLSKGANKLRMFLHLNSIYIFKLCNFLLEPFWNKLFLINKNIEGLKFGDINKTLSEQLGDNLYHKNLTKYGLFLVSAINYIDPFHIQKSSPLFEDYHLIKNKTNNYVN